MNCDLTNFPAPPNHKNGWPWIDAEATLSPSANLPRITVITPCLNSAATLEETIRSVLLQGYANLEYFVFDGGSSDESVQIIKKYEPWIQGWRSECDSGQSNAINKAAALSTGDLINWVNADDILLPGALSAIGHCYLANHGSVIAGNARWANLDKGVCTVVTSTGVQNELVKFWNNSGFCQPAVFVPQRLWFEAGGLDESLDLCMDYDLYCKIAANAQYAFTDTLIAEFREHSQAKSFRLRAALIEERTRVSRKCWVQNNVSPEEQKFHDEAVGKEIGIRLYYLLRHGDLASAKSYWHVANALSLPLSIVVLSAVQRAITSGVRFPEKLFAFNAKKDEVQ